MSGIDANKENTQAYLALKQVARDAILQGVDAYDFRRMSAMAVAQAAVELENGNKSGAARRIKVRRITIERNLAKE